MFFELDDIKRRHSYTYDVYNVFSWIDTPDNKFSWNWQRGAITGIIASTVNEMAILFTENWRLLLREYEWPKGLKQYGIFTRETLKLDNFRLGMKNRLQYALCIGTFDIGSRLALFREFNAGWYRTFGSFETNYLRKIPTTILAAFLSSWVSVPFELARMTYYGDKTFPKELQKGYTSYLNALRRIPFEEGPYYLFKNSFPIIARNFMQTYTAFFAYDWLKDKIGGVTTRISDFPFPVMKLMIGGLSTTMALIFSFPFYYTAREVVDYWPKLANGKTPWEGNYRKAAVWLYYHNFGSNLFPGLFNNYFWRNFPWLFLTLWIGDRMGIFNYWRNDPYMGAGNNTWEDTFC